MKGGNMTNKILKNIGSVLGLTVGIAGGLYGLFRVVEGRSLTSYVLEKTLVRNDYKRSDLKRSKEEVNQYFHELEMINEKPVRNPSPILKKDVREDMIDGMQVFVWNDHDDPNQRVIMYLHGGSYIHQPSDLHYKAVEDVSKQTDAKAVFPVYPKAPKYTYKDAFPKIEKVYRRILENVDSPERITLAGDSAGGGMTLALAIRLKKLELPQPKDIILLSPWLNISTQHPEIQVIYDKDPILNVTLTAEIASKWAGGIENFQDPLVSPMYADVRNLGCITIFIGTYDILYPSVQLFHEILEDLGIEHHYYEKRKMVHDYSGLPIPEGKKARKQMANIIQTKHEKNTTNVSEDYFFGYTNLDEMINFNKSNDK